MNEPNNEMPSHIDGSVEHHGSKAEPTTKTCDERTTTKEYVQWLKEL
jgi:hypothetical protein